MSILVYGAAGLSARWEPADRTNGGICGAWFCPDEFSRSRLATLQQQAWDGTSSQATSELKRALIYDSASPYRWADLAEVLANSKQLKSARYCFQRALATGPHNPAILCRAANFYFSSGDYPATLRCLSAVLSNPDLDTYYWPAFLTYSRMGLPISRILNDGIPPKPLAAQSFLRFLMEQGRATDAETAWSWIADRSLNDDRITGEYMEFLIGKKQAFRAAESWRELNRSSLPEYLNTNWIFNGSFEFLPRPSPLDWRIEPAESVATNRECNVSRDGRCAMEVAFSAKENIDYHGLVEQTVIRPGKWHFQGFIKTDGITSDQGISLRIYDAVDTRNLDIQTPPLTGTHNWTKVDRDFEASARTNLVHVEIVRHASLKFDSKIAGRAWIDSLELRPARRMAQ
ncbi:MAG: hypothetical protein JOY62_03625 [Acidobacteriaceae bacterium]|nr:hypothetical protein [Acidobacteriaceae bacterium]MBV9779041.1 hypothetical protein [Acidobacteriaceae bacterium]